MLKHFFKQGNDYHKIWIMVISDGTRKGRNRKGTWGVFSSESVLFLYINDVFIVLTL